MLYGFSQLSSPLMSHVPSRPDLAVANVFLVVKEPLVHMEIIYRVAT